MFSSRLPLAAFIGAAALAGAVSTAVADDSKPDPRTTPKPLPAQSVDGFTKDYKPTPFTLNLDGTPTQWLTGDKNRPQPPRAPNAKLQATPPPAGADILFDGTEASRDAAWKPLPVRRGKPTPWVVKKIRDAEGAPEYSVLIGTNQDVHTKKGYGDAKLHIEWRVPQNRTGSGQSGTNSGVMFADGRYEIQVLDSFNNFTYADGMAGSIYAQFPPKFNASLPRGEWQSYDITFTAPRFDAEGNTTKRARFTVVFNGVVVQDDQELVGDGSYRSSSLFPTKALKENAKARHGHRLLSPHPVRLPLRLQFHGDPIQFRNIWIQDLEK
ncbi:MAG: DUF1080 domain-containing protein [Puniceicoccales bacterium]|jgi:hypothetical protein|nr:DUF1080 domain-containing protein [Puniceicoccales bacterium]